MGLLPGEQDLDAQVGSALTCTKYQDRDGIHTDVRWVTPASLPNVDRSLLFCETVQTAETTRGWCTALLAHRDLLVRLQVQAGDGATALSAVQKMGAQSAATLARG